MSYVPRELERVDGVVTAFAQKLRRAGQPHPGPALGRAQKCRFANACPDPLFRYFSKCWACSMDSNATYNLSFQGTNFDVCGHLPALWSATRWRRSAVCPK